LRDELALDLVDPLEVEVEQPPHEPYVQQQVLLPVGQRCRRPLMPAPPPDAPPPPRLWEPGVLEAMATAAGLTPEDAFDASWAYEYEDEQALGRAMVAPAGIAALAGPSREPSVRREIVEALASFRTPPPSQRRRARTTAPRRGSARLHARVRRTS
jgi:hypothetical protein